MNEPEQGASSETPETPVENTLVTEVTSAPVGPGNLTVEPMPEVPVETTIDQPTIEVKSNSGDKEPTLPEVESTKDIPQEEKNLLEAEFLNNASVASFIVDAIEGNGALKKEDEGVTLRLKPVETTETTAFFKSFPPVLHIGVVNPEVAAKFKVGGRLSLILLNED